MSYAPMMFCEHANECPTSICRCPSNCGCRELMCKAPRPVVAISQVSLPGTPCGFEATGHIQSGPHGEYCLANFDRCHFWGSIHIGASEQTELEVLKIERLAIEENTVRDIVAGHLPIQLFRDVELVLDIPIPAPFQMKPFRISMVWGDFMLYETGEPAIRNFLAIPGTYQGMPPPAVVSRALRALRSFKIPL